MAISFKTPQEILLEISVRAKQNRLNLNLTQAGLAKRSGVSLGSLKRFEHSGQISLEALLNLAMVLGTLNDFETLFTKNQTNRKLSLDEIIKKIPIRKKGTIK